MQDDDSPKSDNNKKYHRYSTGEYTRKYPVVSAKTTAMLKRQRKVPLTLVKKPSKVFQEAEFNVWSSSSFATIASRYQTGNSYGQWSEMNSPFPPNKLQRSISLEKIYWNEEEKQFYYLSE